MSVFLRRLHRNQEKDNLPDKLIRNSDKIMFPNVPLFPNTGHRGPSCHFVKSVSLVVTAQLSASN